jgi:hypothetical protein
MSITGGATGNGITVSGGATSGIGIDANGTGGNADIEANITGNVVGSVGSVTNAVTVGTMNSGTITSATFAAGALGAVWDETVPGAHASGTSGHILGTALPDTAPDATGGLPVIGGTQAISATLAAGAITTGTMDNFALNEIRNKFLIVNDTLNSPTTTSTRQ